MIAEVSERLGGMTRTRGTFEAEQRERSGMTRTPDPEGETTDPGEADEKRDHDRTANLRDIVEQIR